MNCVLDDLGLVYWKFACSLWISFRTSAHVAQVAVSMQQNQNGQDR